MIDEVERAHRERLPRMKRSKTGIGSFYTHKMVLPTGIENLGRPAYRVQRRQNEIIYLPEMISRALNGRKGMARRTILINATKNYRKKVAV